MKNFKTRYRYYSIIVWINTFGLIFSIRELLRINRQDIDPSDKEENERQIREELAKVMIFLGLLFLGIWLFVASKLLLLLSVLLVVFGFFGMIVRGMEYVLDQIVG